LSGDSKEAQEPLVEARELAFAQLLRDLDETEHRDDDNQERHEHGGLLAGEPADSESAYVTGQMSGVAQMAAGREVSRGAAGSKVGHRFHCTLASGGRKRPVVEPSPEA
jgi:hypothetical protein